MQRIDVLRKEVIANVSHELRAPLALIVGYSQLKLELCDLPKLMESSEQYAREVAGQYGISVTLLCDEGIPPMRMDALKISQVLRNLLNNAINHMQSGETIIVSVQKAQAMTVTVTNPGAPIPPEEADMIWERYSRRQHQGERKEGTGIGLAIVRTILESHGFGYGVLSGEHENSFWFCTEKDGFLHIQGGTI